jgi:hypothetical protein
LEESNKAIFFVLGDELTEKVSGFSDDSRYRELKDVVKVVSLRVSITVVKDVSACLSVK